MNRWLVLILFLAVPLAQGTFESTSEADLWSKSALDRGYALRFINPSLCAQNDTWKKACRSALAEGLRQLEGFEILPPGLAADFKNDKNPNVEVWLRRLDEIPRNPAKAMMFGKMVNELISQFDPHGRILPIELIQSRLGSGGEVGPRSGFQLVASGRGLFIESVEASTPAEHAKLQAGDQILSVNGKDVGVGLQAEEMRQTLSALSIHPLRLEIRREGQTFLKTLRPVNLPREDVEGHYDEKTQVGELYVGRFRSGICDRVSSWINEKSQSGLKGLILDLRKNGGGRYDEAACVFRLFAGEKLIGYRKYLSKSLVPAALGLRPQVVEENEIYETYVSPAVYKNPLIVIVDQRTASVSEMISGALQDHQRAWIVGERTYGKGDFQLVDRLFFHDGLRFVHTIYEMIRPSSRPIQVNGIAPNFVVPFREGALAKEREFSREGEIYKEQNHDRVAEPWSETRPAEVRHLTRCIKNQRDHRIPSDDNQMKFAKDLRTCILRR